MSDQNGTAQQPTQPINPGQQAINALAALRNWNLLLIEPHTAGLELRPQPPRQIIFSVANFLAIFQNNGMVLNALVEKVQSLEQQLTALQAKLAELEGQTQ